MTPAEPFEPIERTAPSGGIEHHLPSVYPTRKEAPMHVALAADERFFAGMACAIFSVVLASERDPAIEFHVMDGGIDADSWSFLEGKLSALGSGIRLRRVPISKAAFDGFPTDERGGVMTYARLLMESLLDADEVIYLDCDILCFRNLRELWDRPMGNNLIAACQDWAVKVLADDTVVALNEEDAGRMYFNAGLIKANLRLWREEGVQAQTVGLLREFGTRLRWWDQTALNLVCKGRVQYLDGANNFYYIHEVTLEDFAEGRINIHYATKRKPWQTYDGKIISNIVWRIYFMRCMGEWGEERYWPTRFMEIRYKIALFLVNACGTLLIAAIGAARVCAGCLPWSEGLCKSRDWLDRRRTGIRIIQWAWRKAGCLRR